MRFRRAVPAVLATVLVCFNACSGCDEGGVTVNNGSNNGNNGQTTNNGQTNNECVPDSDADVCSSAGAECGEATLEDNCGQSREVDCGACENGAACGADNTCECVDPAADICARLMKDCGTLDVTDDCGVDRTIDCGTCMDGEECGADNVCGCPCTIDGQCVPEGMVNPANPCQVCDPASASDDWTGIAVGSACDDGLSCTTDTTCNADAECVGTLAADFCIIDGACLGAGAPDPTSACRVCDPAVDLADWSDVPQGNACDDGLACTSGTSCDGIGNCVPTGITAGTCAIDGACYNQGDLNPNNPCQVCAPADQQDDWGNVALATACDDGLACTSGTACDGAGECVGTIAAGTCAINGVCYNDAEANPNDSCEVCSAMVDQDNWSPVAAGTACDDGLTCTANDMCDGGGDCEGTLAADQCLIGGQCYAADAAHPNRECLYCNPADDPEDWTVLPAGTACDDDLACTGDGTCNPGGNCRAGTPMAGTCAIDDACYNDGDINPANSCESCQAALDGTQWSPRTGTACDDGLTCTTNDACTDTGACLGEVDTGFCAAEGACYADGELNPSNSCEVCDAAAEQTDWSPVAAATTCDDGLACTTGDACDGAGECVAATITAGSCVIDDACHATGAANPMNECEVCDPATDAVDWSPAADATACGTGGANLCCAGMCLAVMTCP